MPRHRIPLAIAAAAFAVLGTAVPAAADDLSMQPVRGGPTPTPVEPGMQCHVIDFESAQVLTSRTSSSRPVLVVRGEKPYLNMQVSLVPLVYIRQPEYWGIEVVGCIPGLGLPATAPYVVKLPLDGTIGTIGIEVIGSSHSEKIVIPGRPAQV